MALRAAPPAQSPRPALRSIPGRRSDVMRVSLAVNDALAPCIEGQALCGEADDAVTRITELAASGSMTAVIDEAGRLGYRVAAYRAELRRLAEAIEPRVVQ